jgi:UDP-glucose 4-epimerase
VANASSFSTTCHGFRSATLGTPRSSVTRAIASLVARVLREHAVDTGAALRRAHDRAGIGVRPAQVLTGNNTCATRTLLEQCDAAGVRRFVFSSTAAVYGVPAAGLAREDSPNAPINPYGTSKLMSEWMLRDLAAASSTLRYVALRYFNVAGSDPGGRLGHSAPTATLLVKVACRGGAGRATLAGDIRHGLPNPDGTWRARLHPQSRTWPPLI